LGFCRSGFEIALAADIDPVAVEHHSRNLSSPVIEVDLTKGLPESNGDVDVLVAGPPCQGFSTLGRRDPDDPRNALFDIPAHAAERYMPRFFLLENVAGLRAGPHASRLEGSASRLRAVGYKVMTVDLEMHHFGVPQRRRRVIQLGWRGDTEFRLTIQGRRRPPQLADFLKDLDGVANHDPRPLLATSRSGRIARRIKAGQKLCNVRQGPSAVATWTIPEVFGRVSPTEIQVLQGLARLRRRDRRRNWGDSDPVRARALSKFVGFPTHPHLRRLIAAGYVRQLEDRTYDLTHTFNGKYRRAKPRELAPAVDTRFGDAHYVLHPRAHRAFTVREAARVQGFPDWFEFFGARRAQSRMIANAVPPPVAEALAKQIQQFLTSHDG
jgi:DNA (cytosine-5)-methyltransferase 1